MFGFFLKGATYYVLWQKFQKRALFIIGSIITIAIINSVYHDLFAVMKVNNKESLFELLMVKWLFILAILFLNFYMLKYTSVEVNETEKEIESPLPSKSQEVLDKKEELQSISDVILQKYTRA